MVSTRLERLDAAPLPPSRAGVGGRWTSWLRLARALFSARLAWLGVLIVVVVVLMAASADYITPYDPIDQDYNAILQSPDADHWLGTDDVGRDIYSRIVYGTRVSLLVGLASVLFAVACGVPMGLAAGFWGGWIDSVLMRITDALWSFPGLILALAVAAALGPGLNNVVFAVGIVSVPIFSRLVRGEALAVRERDFFLAAHALGAGPVRMMVRHLLPNVIAPVIVQASLNVSLAIITEASLSFLGLGVAPPTPSWGSMLRTGYGYIDRAWWISVFPGLAMFLTVVGLNVLGDALRLVLDPRLRSRGTS
jgi:peptide/nickel transport system permease protein